MEGETAMIRENKERIWDYLKRLNGMEPIEKRGEVPVPSVQAIVKIDASCPLLFPDLSV
ncbi:unnamed protein product [Dovyalis caffra]|uniref:Uncharacterized protein n=1 Tax=Dovyalis caffra TaxID=77055 RepID=A0AAV1RBQ7_9ROSI|nr:unnamed protein product [Dovyalis caffra]